MEEGDNFEEEGYEQSPKWEEKELKRKDKNNLSFEVEFDRYDSRGKEIADADLYPIKTAIPSRNRPKPLPQDKSNEEFDNKFENEKDEEDRYLQR